MLLFPFGHVCRRFGYGACWVELSIAVRLQFSHVCDVLSFVDLVEYWHVTITNDVVTSSATSVSGSRRASPASTPATNRRWCWCGPVTWPAGARPLSSRIGRRAADVVSKTANSRPATTARRRPSDDRQMDDADDDDDFLSQLRFLQRNFLSTWVSPVDSRTEYGHFASCLYNQSLAANNSFSLTNQIYFRNSTYNHQSTYNPKAIETEIRLSAVLWALVADREGL